MTNVSDIVRIKGRFPTFKKSEPKHQFRVAIIVVLDKSKENGLRK